MLPHAGVFNELFGPLDQLSGLFQDPFGFLDRGTQYSFHRVSLLRDTGKKSAHGVNQGLDRWDEKVTIDSGKSKLGPRAISAGLKQVERTTSRYPGRESKACGQP
jgi:hypothetical protein